MRHNIAGGTYSLNEKQFDAQRCVNLEPFISEVGNSRTQKGLRGTAGLSPYNSDVNGAMRGAITTGKGRCFFVGNNKLYEIDSDGNETERGTLNTAVGQVSMADNGTQLMIVDGANGYIFTYSSNGFSQISDGDFPNGCKTVVFLDGYFIVEKQGTGTFYISALLDGTSWDALDFATAATIPDDILAVQEVDGDLWVISASSIEVFYNSGNADFPFERVSKGVINSGCISSHAQDVFDNSLVWVEQDEHGRARVMRSVGYQEKRISTQAIEQLIDSAGADIADSYIYTYQQEGHEYAVFQITGLNTTLVYDAFTQEWHERQYHDANDNVDKQHLGSCHCLWQGKNLIGDRLTGNIYSLERDYYFDNGQAIHRERITPPFNKGQNFVINSLEVDIQAGVGLQEGQGSDPKIMVSPSRDGGNTFGNERFLDMGAVGKYKTRARALGWGVSREWVFKIRVTDPVRVVLHGDLIINES